MAFYFAVNLLCAYVSCVRLREYPSDPLSSARSPRVHQLPIDDLIVHTKDGGLEGYIMQTIRRRPIHAFEGIPYAEPPIGSNRFEPPIPKKSWNGVRPAKGVSHFCTQWHLVYLHVFGNEDCLYLNVYTPKMPRNGKNPNLPVIVYIHGGSYFFGSGAEYGPAYLLEEDVILVTINYRLGILGFLSTGDKVLPGNNGMKDQVLALKWVHENIKSFGGDPSRATIMGQSSGAASVHLHMMSKLSRPYFSGAISLSGTAFNPWSLGNDAFMHDVVLRLSDLTKCDSRDSHTFLACLRDMNAYHLTGKFTRLHRVPDVPPVVIPPVIEADAPGAFLTKHPDQVYADGEVATVPWICGSTQDEGQFPWLPLKGFRLDGQLRRRWNKVAPTVLLFKFTADNPEAVNNQIDDFYFGTRDIGHLKNASEFPVLLTDRLFGYPVHKALQSHLKFAPTYAHIFGYKGRHGLAEFLGLDYKEFGVGHIEDLPFIFNMSRYFKGYKTTDQEFAVIKLVTSMIANFAKIREPLYTDENGKNFKIWDPVTDPKNIRMLQIDEDVKMIPEPNRQRLKFWETLPLKDINPMVPFD